MDLIIALILGLLIGWLIEWIIDWLFWRKEAEQPKPVAAKPQDNLEEELLAEIVELRQKLALANGQISTLGVLSDSTSDGDEAKRLRDKLAAAEAMIGALGAQVANAQRWETQSNALQSDMEMMAAQLNSASAIRVQLDAAQSEITGLRARAADSEMWRNKAIAAEAEVNKLKSESSSAAVAAPPATLPTSANGSEVIINDLIGKLANAEDRASRLPIAEAMIASLGVQLAEAQEWRKRFDESDAAFNNLWKEMGDDKQKIIELEGALSRAREAASVASDTTEFQKEITRLESELDQSKRRVTQLSEYEFEYNHLKSELSEVEHQRVRIADLESELNQLRARPAEVERPHPRAAELEAEVSRLGAIETDYEGQRRRIMELESQVERLRAKKKADKGSTKRLAELTAEVERLQNILSKHNQTVNDYEGEIEELRARNVEQDQVLDQLRVAQTEDERQLAAIESEIDRARVEAEKPKPAPEQGLRMITGIGPVYAQRLKDAGIESYADLAKLTPQEVRDIMKVQKWQRLDADSWIAQAVELSGAHIEKPKKVKKKK
ncbi:MAG: helix-hairpin-helix domain-containing protein [Chloroflexota bacterium]